MSFLDFFECGGICFSSGVMKAFLNAPPAPSSLQRDFKLEIQISQKGMLTIRNLQILFVKNRRLSERGGEQFGNIQTFIASSRLTKCSTQLRVKNLFQLYQSAIERWRVNRKFICVRQNESMNAARIQFGLTMGPILGCFSGPTVLMRGREIADVQETAFHPAAAVHCSFSHYSLQETSPAPCGLTWFGRAWDRAASSSVVANIRSAFTSGPADDEILRFGFPFKERRLEHGQPIEPV